jgi:hypothetical protein
MTVDETELSTWMSPKKLERSLAALSEARHSNAMEGLHECPEDAATLDSCARREISDDEARRRILVRIARENTAR